MPTLSIKTEEKGPGSISNLIWGAANQAMNRLVDNNYPQFKKGPVEVQFSITAQLKHGGVIQTGQKTEQSTWVEGMVPSCKVAEIIRRATLDLVKKIKQQSLSESAGENATVDVRFSQ